MVAAKAVVVGAVSLAAGLAAAFGSVLLAGPVMRGNGLAPPPLSDAAVLRAVLGTGVLLGVIAVFSLAVAAIVLGVLAVGGEYATGTITATLAAVPRRGAVLAAKAAKAAVVAAVVAAAGSAGVLASLAAGRAILPGNGFTAANGYPPLSPLDGPTARAAAGTVLYLVLVALLSLGVGTAVREQAAAITAVLGLLWIVPVVTQFIGDAQWQERLERLAPMSAGLAVQATRDLELLPIGPWAGMGVMAGYAGAALLAGGVLLAVRDA